jgi:hypothetical protein
MISSFLARQLPKVAYGRLHTIRIIRLFHISNEHVGSPPCQAHWSDSVSFNSVIGALSFTADGVVADGHGTHVAGIIASQGIESAKVMIETI